LPQRPIEPEGGLAIGGQPRLRIQKVAVCAGVSALEFQAEPGRQLDARFGVLKIIFVVEVFAVIRPIGFGVKTAFGAQQGRLGGVAVQIGLFGQWVSAQHLRAKSGPVEGR
jgi:hypothetical protein